MPKALALKTMVARPKAATTTTTTKVTPASGMRKFTPKSMHAKANAKSSSIKMGKADAMDMASDDVSASDSLVAIRALEDAQRRQEDARRRAPSATDQVSRFAAAHAHAAAAAVGASDQSEGTIDRVANAARRAAAPTSAQSTSASRVSSSTSDARHRLAAMAPPPAGVARDAFNGSGGQQPPMDMQDNYRMFHRQAQRSVRASGDAPIAGQVGNRIADVASQLVRETNQTAVTGQLPRVLSSTVSPLMDTFCRMLVQRAVPRADVPPHLNDPQSDSLQRIRQAVRVSRRAHEERMLRLPRAGEPPCSMGHQCTGNQIQCQGGGGTLVAFYYEEEWAKYQAELSVSSLAARLPEQSRQCLLCIRYDTHRCIMSLRNDDMQFAVETTIDDQTATPVILQPHFNLVDVEGEYPSSFCWTPVLEAYEGLPYPTVKPSLLYFTRVADTKTGDVFFRQKIPHPKLHNAPARITDASAPSVHPF